MRSVGGTSWEYLIHWGKFKTWPPTYEEIESLQESDPLLYRLIMGWGTTLPATSGSMECPQCRRIQVSYLPYTQSQLVCRFCSATILEVIQL